MSPEDFEAAGHPRPRPALQRFRRQALAAPHGAGKRVRLWILRFVERFYREVRR